MELTDEEKKIIFHSVKYWQTHKASVNGKDYEICNNILERIFKENQQ
jgi:hypothetical protein